MLNIVGGTYIERCLEPISYKIFGSGLRASIALSGKEISIQFNSCVGEKELETASSLCNTFNIKASFLQIEETISFIYDHPLSSPEVYPNVPDNPAIVLDPIDSDIILYYGMIEATAKVNGTYVIYDPQNYINFKSTGSTAKHLAIILNRKEAIYFYGSKDSEDLHKIGKALLDAEDAEVIVIKDGSNGALVVENSGYSTIPVFKTDSVWPIGSGDIFSAVFAWKWAEEKLPAKEAAYIASLFTAFYCDTQDIQLPNKPRHYDALPKIADKKKVYLAGPFFTMGERWLIQELRQALIDFGNIVFSPFHDVGLGSSPTLVQQDIEGIINSDVLLAVFNGSDPGTLFEIGYAKALGKKVVVIAENASSQDLFMLVGTGCEITYDIATAVYKTSW